MISSVAGSIRWISAAQFLQKAADQAERGLRMELAGRFAAAAWRPDGVVNKDFGEGVHEREE